MKYLKNVTTLTYDPEKCKGCERCVEVCPHGVFAMEKNKAIIVDKDLCMECGACSKNCEYSAIEVQPGVGCAFAILIGMIQNTEPDCGCSGTGGKKSSCCG